MILEMQLGGMKTTVYFKINSDRSLEFHCVDFHIEHIVRCSLQNQEHQFNSRNNDFNFCRCRNPVRNDEMKDIENLRMRHWNSCLTTVF